MSPSTDALQILDTTQAQKLVDVIANEVGFSLWKNWKFELSPIAFTAVTM